MATTVNAGATATVTLATDATIDLSVSGANEALVNVTRAGRTVFGDSARSDQSFGPFKAGDICRITAGRGAIGYDATQLCVGSQPIEVQIQSGADAASTIQATLDAVKATGRRSTRIIVRSGGAFNLTSGITVDPWYHNIDFDGAVVTYTPTSGTAITVFATQVNAFTQLIGGVNNINLRGPVGVNTAIGILYTGDAASVRTSTANYNITIHGFDVALDFYKFAYLTFFYGLVINRFVSFGLRQRVGDDSGENIAIFGGHISDGAGCAIQALDDTTEINLYGVSIDYNVQCYDIQTGHVNMMSGHIEYQGATSANDQIIVRNQGGFYMFGGQWVVNSTAGAGPYAYAYVVNVVDTNSQARFVNVRMVNHRNTADLWATGAGAVVLDGSIFFNVSLMPYRFYAPNNLLTDGTAEATIGQDLWYIQSDAGGAGASRLVGGSGLAITRDTTTFRSGAGSVRMRRAAQAPAYTQICSIAVPVASYVGRRIIANLWAYSDMGDNTIITTHWSRLQKLDSNDRPVWHKQTQYGSITQNFPASWTQVAISNGPLLVPPWATHLEIRFNITYGVSLSSLYVDDFTVEPV